MIKLNLTNLADIKTKVRGKNRASPNKSKIRGKIKGFVVYSNFHNTFMYKEKDVLYKIITHDVGTTLTLYPTKANNHYKPSEKKSSVININFLESLSVEKRVKIFKLWSRYYDGLPVYKVEYIPTTGINYVKLLSYG